MVHAGGEVPAFAHGPWLDDPRPPPESTGRRAGGFARPVVGTGSGLVAGGTEVLSAGRIGSPASRRALSQPPPLAPPAGGRRRRPARPGRLAHVPRRQGRRQ